jgi:hypothetical protein
MAMARSCPGDSEFAIVDKPCFGQAKNHRCGDIILDPPSFQVSEELALTFRPRHKCIERNCVSYFVRVEPLTT